MHKMRINLASRQELLDILGHRRRERAIVRHRARSGPIKDGAQLAVILGSEAVTSSMLDHVDFTPSDSTAPEAPGA